MDTRSWRVHKYQIINHIITTLRKTFILCMKIKLSYLCRPN
jgi:hypothetical protein